MRNIGLGDRMKQYEQVTQVRLIRRMPVILRLDGKSFHRFTRGFEKPFDPVMLTAMQNTMQELCSRVEGCVLGYTQSDEISLVLCGYQQLDTEAWFGNKLQKLCSISASICTSAFQKYFREAASTLGYTDYLKRADQANFDSRAFNLPMEEVNNYFVWRQRDAIRNSIQATAQAYFSHKQLNGVNCKKALEMLQTEKQVNWNEFHTSLKRGTCCIKMPQLLNQGTPSEIVREKWCLDLEIPVFSEDCTYVEKRIHFEDAEAEEDI